MANTQPSSNLRLSAYSIIATTQFHVFAVQWDTSSPTSPTTFPAIPSHVGRGDYLTPAHYASLYHLMCNIRSAHSHGRINDIAYRSIADRFNGISEIAASIHGDEELTAAINEHYAKKSKPASVQSTSVQSTSTQNSTLTSHANIDKKTSQTPSLFDDDVIAINEPIDTNIYPYRLFSGIFNRRISPPAWCVISNGDYEMVSIVDWLTMDSPPTLQPFVDPFDGVEGY